MEQGHEIVCFGGRSLTSKSVEAEIGHKRPNENYTTNFKQSY